MNERGLLLIVDDDAALCDALARAFSWRGYEIATAGTFAQALAIIAEGAPDRAILDLCLPGGHGLKLVSALKAANPDARIVVFTGYGSVPTAVEAIKRGATYYLAKPASATEIEAAFEHDVERDAVTAAIQPMSLPRLEWEHIQRVLHECDNNISAAARALAIHRRTLQRKLAKRPVRR